MPPLAKDLMFIEEYKSRIKLKNGKTMSLRPLLPSDEIAYRNFFYSLTKETVYMRFFHVVTIFSREMAQDHWATMDYRNNISLIGLVPNRGTKDVVAIGTYAKIDDTLAEVAFVVREDFQNQGIARYIFKELERVASANGFKGFFATTLPENKAMINLCKKCFTDTKITANQDEIDIWMKFT